LAGLLKLNWPRRGLLIVAVLLILLSWWQVSRLQAGLEVRTLAGDGVPMTLIFPDEDQDRPEPHPGVMIAHGFGGSRQIMLGYAYTLAHAGYATLLWDFDGHGANPAPLVAVGRDGSALQSNLDAAYRLFVNQPEVDAGRIGLLGHSMGSGAVMAAAIRDAEQYRGTVAVSPTGAEVTPSVPRNLLLQAGAYEGRFVANAEQLLAAAGGETDDFAAGRARALQIIPGVEHITILFSPLSHRQALDWLNVALNSGFGAGQYTDVRMVWYGVHLLGWLIGLVAVSPLLPKSRPEEEKQTRPPRHVLALVVSPVLGALALWVIVRAIAVLATEGLAISSTFALWVFIWGLFWLLLGFRPRLFPVKDLLWGVVFFVILWLAVGLLAQFTWLPWFLIPVRLLRWPFFAAAFLPWMWAAALAQQGAPTGQRVLWWLGQSVFLIVGMLVLAWLVPDMGILFLVMPLIPLVLALLAIGGAVFDRPGAYAVGSALFFGWLVLAYFPLL